MTDTSGLRRVARLRDEERGDVPGWVLITLMTAGPDITESSKGRDAVDYLDRCPGAALGCGA